MSATKPSDKKAAGRDLDELKEFSVGCDGNAFDVLKALVEIS